MGHKHSKNKNKKENKDDNIINPKIKTTIDDDDDLFDENEFNKTSETCPNCSKVFNLNTSFGKNFWEYHKKICKPKNNNINPPPASNTLNQKQCPTCKVMFNYSSQ